MQLKSGVVLAGLHPAWRMALTAIEKEYEKASQEFVITSTTDGIHSLGVVQCQKTKI